jgi:glutamate synthase (NADPH/NADH) large chain
MDVAPVFCPSSRRKGEGDVLHRRTLPTKKSAKKTSEMHGFSIDSSNGGKKENALPRGGAHAVLSQKKENNTTGRTPPGLPGASGLYDPRHEHDACGVGLVADLSAVPSRRVVESGLEVLKRLMHRGAAGSDPETGDGAGILLSMPDAFFRRLFPSLPPKGRYAVAMVFGGTGDEEAAEKILLSECLPPLFWRDVPVDPAAIGRAARETMPRIRQLFVDGAAFPDAGAFARKLFVARRQLEKALPGMYVCSFSARSIVYKGLLLAPQMEHFYLDLAEKDFVSPLALVHQRYSTNTFPSWQLAHPFRFLAHNGEINTLRGNRTALAAREPHLANPLFGKDLRKVFPLLDETMSDSASLDAIFELLVASGRSPAHALMMLVPQAWGAKHHMGADIRAFYEYHASLMEPWDGPAAIACSDGVNAAAILDRNGLRPARYTLLRDGFFVLASETGVLDLPANEIVRKGRLSPGEILFLDLERHRLVGNAEVKNSVARSKPFRRWVAENKLEVNGLFSGISASRADAALPAAQKRFGYGSEDIDTILRPMAETGHEPVGSMGNDAALAVLSARPQLLFAYFRQLFAQVTNPPIDPIREELVMSRMTFIGNRPNILSDNAGHARLVKLPRPVLTDEELHRLESIGEADFRCKRLAMSFPRGGDGEALRLALRALEEAAVSAVEKDGVRMVILSDRDLPDGEAPIPSLLACAAVNKALKEAGLRPQTGLILETGEAREVMHFALLLGYGATAVNPYLALATVSALAPSLPVPDPVKAAANYIGALDKGLMKIMSKMGISTLRSYRSSQLFEAVGLGERLVAEFFPGTISRIGGLELDGVARGVERRLAEAEADVSPLLPDRGIYKWRKNGEKHLWSSTAVATFRKAVQSGDYTLFKQFSGMVDSGSIALRSLFEFAPRQPIPLDKVESEESILRRFVSGAMSLGSLSPEAHETIARAMNSIGAMSNSGEGGENPERFGTELNSAIKQVASGRFGVTAAYLRSARDIQIKMAQGAKPGEGGQLPGHKVNAFVARIRHSTPGVTLISPPPHHDIYSIEDLAELVYDLKESNPAARVSVKLVSEPGVGTVAAGVAKAHADVVLVSGGDGGTGASPLSSIMHAGLPWELGLAETQQTLVKNGLRDRVKVQVDGKLATGRDVVVGALLGAEEFGFATAILVALGCAMMRHCHANTCPFGVATQDCEMRKRFAGKPEHIVNFLTFVAREVREHLASLGLASLDEACGRSDLLRVKGNLPPQAEGLDFSAVLAPPAEGARRSDPAKKWPAQDSFDARELLPRLPLDGTRGEWEGQIRNTDRAVGTRLSSEIVAKCGEAGLPDGTLRIQLHGTAGQSFGAFLAKGVEMELVGEANDFVGKGLSGGTIVVRPPEELHLKSGEDVIAGNVVGYGATSGAVYLAGAAGERFAIRNSGATLVSEGTGDHGCEYMTGGRVVVAGPTGVNFAAGMTGGIAYVLDEKGDFDLRCNLESVDLEPVEEGGEAEAELLALLKEHAKRTGSRRVKEILENWEEMRPRFIRVFPEEYRKALARAAEKGENA